MPNYRRAKIPGALYFFTLVTYQRHHIFVDKGTISLLKRNFQRIRNDYPFSTEGIVVLPDHLHVLWSLPENDADFPLRWRLLKTLFTKEYLQDQDEPYLSSISRQRKGERAVWQRRYWEHYIRDKADMRRHLEYIHYNPVKHGYTRRPSDWPWSSFHRYVDRGWYDETWGETEPEDLLLGCVGEAGG